MTTNKYAASFGVLKMSSNLVVVVVAQPCEYIKYHYAYTLSSNL